MTVCLSLSSVCNNDITGEGEVIGETIENIGENTEDAGEVIEHKGHNKLIQNSMGHRWGTYGHWNARWDVRPHWGYKSARNFGAA